MHSHFHDPQATGARRNKVVNAAEAVRLIHDGDTTTLTSKFSAGGTALFF